jgi:hypothetical protein
VINKRVSYGVDQKEREREALSGCCSLSLSAARCRAHSWPWVQRMCVYSRKRRRYFKPLLIQPSAGVRGRGAIICKTDPAAAATDARIYAKVHQGPLSLTLSVFRSPVPRRHSISIIIPAPMPSGPICFHLCDNQRAFYFKCSR